MDRAITFLNNPKVMLLTLFLGMIMFSCDKQSSALSGTTWQLQNPDKINVAKAIKFLDDSNYTASGVNLITGNETEFSGLYVEKDDSLIVSYKDKRVSFFLVRINDCKISLTYSGHTYFYALSGSKEDKFIKDYLGNGK